MFFLLLGFFSSFVEVIVIKVQIVLIISCPFLISFLVFVHISVFFLCLIFTLFWLFCKLFQFFSCPLCVCLPSHFGYSEFLCVEFILCLRLFSLPATVLHVVRVRFEHCDIFTAFFLFLVSFHLFADVSGFFFGNFVSLCVCFESCFGRFGFLCLRVCLFSVFVIFWGFTWNFLYVQ